MFLCINGKIMVKTKIKVTWTPSLSNKFHIEEYKARDKTDEVMDLGFVFFGGGGGMKAVTTHYPVTVFI